MPLAVGDRVLWCYEPRGGYGYGFWVRVAILEIRGERAKVAATKHDGDPATRWVKLNNLRTVDHHGAPGLARMPPRFRPAGMSVDDYIRTYLQTCRE